MATMRSFGNMLKDNLPGKASSPWMGVDKKKAPRPPLSAASAARIKGAAVPTPKKPRSPWY